MREKTKREKRIVTEDQQKKIIELHKLLPLKQIASQLKMRYDWAYQWAAANGLTLKYCRKVEKSSKHIVNNNASVFDWSNFANGETLFLTGVPKSEIDADLSEPKDAKFLKLFPNFGKKGYDLYYQKSSRK
jgi:hypothetical protein